MVSPAPTEPFELAVKAVNALDVDWVVVCGDLVNNGNDDQAVADFKRIAAAFTCDDCAHNYPPSADVLACPACGSLRVRLTAGDEFYLEALEVATETDAEAEAVKEPMP